MEFLVLEGMSEGTWPFLLKIFDKKISPISTSVECTMDTLQLIFLTKLSSFYKFSPHIYLSRISQSKIPSSCYVHCRAINMITYRNFHLSLISIFLVNSLSKWKIKDRFKICPSWGFQNCHWFSILTKNWLSKGWSKSDENFQKWSCLLHGSVYCWTHG